MLKRPLYGSGLLLLTFISQTVNAALLFNNGDFESPRLAPWEDYSEGDSAVNIADKGYCFAGNDTRTLSIHGEKAAVLSTYGVESTNSSAILRSETFTAGDGFAFIALAATQDSKGTEHHPGLYVEIIDASNDKTIVSQMFSPDLAILGVECPAQRSSMQAEPIQFSSHYFSTQAYSGKAIRLQFRLSAGEYASASFVFIDQVINFEQGEQPLFYSRPYAQAGMQHTSTGMPYLSSMGSFDPDQKPSVLRYTWYVNHREYRLSRPCLIDYDQGNYQAVLYVNDGHYAISDDTQFFVMATGKASNNEESECQMPSSKTSIADPVEVEEIAIPG